jgi:hypothetical protein
VLGVLIEIFRSDAVVADSGFPCEGDVALEYLMGTAADLDVGAVAVEEVISLGRTRGLMVWAVCRCSGRANADLILMSFFPGELGLGFAVASDWRATRIVVCVFGLS